MLTKAGMPLVFVLREKITLGSFMLTAMNSPKFLGYGVSSCKVPQ